MPINTNALKKFAQEARKKLMSQVEAKLEYVLTSDSAELREKANQLSKLQQEISSSSKEEVIDKVSYTWFNRLMALRFMDANDYQPIGLRVITPKEGYTLPELLDEAKQGSIPDELPVKHQRIYDILDGKTPSSNAQNEAFKELLIGACNHLNALFPALFEKINDYAEILLPDDLTSEFSIVQDIREGMTEEDCLDVEVIGWIYQFYISEKKDEVFASKGKVEAAEIPAATQLFTPRWIVEYMVQNTVGKLWLQNNPNSGLKAHMPYYIESPSSESEEYLEIKSVEELTLLDQACGSGHILVYGFELLTKIYEEEGYNPSEIPQLIIENNLFGFEIDERAAQLAGLALMMKARSYHRRVFRKQLQPTILQYKDLRLADEEIENFCTLAKVNLTAELTFDLSFMQQATNLGSLILPQNNTADLEKYKSQIKAFAPGNDVFVQYQQQQLLQAIDQLLLLSQKYYCVVDNPPYMGGSKMNSQLAGWVKKHYPKSKADLMVCFMERAQTQVYENGFVGMINLPSWMFLSSFEEYRKELIKEYSIDTLLHLGRGIFGSDFGSVAFTFIKEKETKTKGIYRRLFKEHVKVRKVETIRQLFLDKDYGYFTTSQNDFVKIPGNPIGYWLSESWLNLFNMSMIDEFSVSEGQNISGDNDRYLRFLWEVSYSEISSRGNWPLMAKGGDFRRWSGNVVDVVNWSNKALNEYRINKVARLQKDHLWFREGITWNLVSSAGTGFRKVNSHQLFNKAAPTILFENEDLKYMDFLLGFLNTKITSNLLSIFNPTINTNIKEVIQLPFDRNVENKQVTKVVSDCVNLSNKEWNFREISCDFTANELIQQNTSSLTEAYEAYCKHWQEQFIQLHQNEEELNKQFIGIYGLQEELTPDVALKDITILRDELDQKALKKLSESFTAGWQLQNGEWQLPNKDAYSNLQLPFDQTEIVKQLISYGVGCLFGRYSLDKEGLILANQGETLEDYLTKIEKSESEVSFLPDDDNIIPVLDDEWFEDDIVGRFYEFLRVTFGKENFDKNLAFVEECIGKDIRTFFVKDFYTDHIKRYKKRPIYWMFSSPKGSFNVLVYMHRYTPDTLNQILNGYLKEYREKLNNRMEGLNHLIETGSSKEQTSAAKEKDKLKLVLLELQEYERDVLYPLATERIAIDLDDGVLVNYNKFGKAIKEVKGLNDKKTKDKVRKFDWINTEEIR